MKKETSIFYDFPVQFPFGREHTGLNGVMFALLFIVCGIIFGLLVVRG